MSTPSHPPARFQQWLEEHRGIVVKVTRSFATTEPDAADLQQEIFLQLWNSLASFQGQAKSSTWVYRVCLNTALTWSRGRRRRERHLDRDAAPDDVPSSAASPRQHVQKQDLLAQLYAAIHQLPDLDRALVLLSLDDLSYREAAEVTGLTENHVGVALTRARQRLATLLKEVAHELE